jgi:hypothetical protein
MHHFYLYDNALKYSEAVFNDFKNDARYYNTDPDSNLEKPNNLFIKRQSIIQITGGIYLNKYSNIGGFPENEQNYNEYTLVNLINFYLIYNNNYINENGIYNKIENSLFSTILKYQKEDLTNKLEEIFFSLRELF